MVVQSIENLRQPGSVSRRIVGKYKIPMNNDDDRESMIDVKRILPAVGGRSAFLEP